MKYIVSIIILLLGLIAISSAQTTQTDAGLQKVQDIVVYQDSQFYAAFPSIIKRKEGGFLAAFRRAPNRKIFGERSTHHVDANSYLVTLESEDGINWSQEPKLMYAHPFGGSQDPCMVQLRDGTIICTSYGWAAVRPDGMANIKRPIRENSAAVFLGGYVLRSEDGGDTWSEPIYPPHLEQEDHFNAMGKPLPSYNRGAMCESRSGTIYWIVSARKEGGRNTNHLLASDDKGLSWQYRSVVAEDSVGSFNEASMYETPAGDLVGFLRTADMDDQACIARSSDGGASFTWQSMGWQGHPLNALQLPDDRVLLTYGYRHEPYGIRARILNAECTDFATAPEFVIRDDGGSRDLGYTWPVMLNNDHVLVIYYFNVDLGIRHIAGSILRIK